MEPRDVYKLLFQGVFGVAHIMGGEAINRLFEEAHRIDLEDHPWEPLIEPANPKGSVIRVNLRPYLKGDGDLGLLFQAMLDSSNVEGNAEEFLTMWREFKRINIEQDLGFDEKSIKECDDRVAEEGIKPMHHSEAYRTAYYPAYRVVSTEIFHQKTSYMFKEE